MKPVMYVLIGILVGLLLAGGILIGARQPQGESVQLRPAPTPEPLRVHVAGAVVRPGVYDLPDNSRVTDAIDAAGGLVAGADENALNLAQHLEDGERLDVPFVEGFVAADATQGFTVLSNGTPSALSGADLVNINTASVDELDKLPGIGQTTAQRIITYRTDNGPFATIEDILNVSGIGTATYNEIKDLITVGQ